MEQRRRRSFFGGDSASGAGSPLPMLSPGGHRHRKRGSWGRIAIGLAALLLLAGGVYYFMLAGRPVVEDHAASLKKIEQMTPEELQAHREERMALHREKMSKRASRAGDRAGDRADRASRAKERERAQEQRRQRRARGRATGDGHGHPVEDGPDASELPAKAHQPEGKFGDGQEAGKPTPGSSRMPPPGGKKEPPAKPPRRGRGSAEGTMPGSPEDLKARKAENVGQLFWPRARPAWLSLRRWMHAHRAKCSLQAWIFFYLHCRRSARLRMIEKWKGGAKIWRSARYNRI